MTGQDFYCTATAYHEARGEPLDGQIAVVHVILNRALTRGLSVREVVYQSKQFECYQKTKTPIIKNYRAFIIACTATEMARQQRLNGESLYGAEYFMNTDLVIERYGRLPTWLNNMTAVTTIKRHTFYKA